MGVDITNILKQNEKTLTDEGNSYLQGNKISKSWTDDRRQTIAQYMKKLNEEGKMKKPQDSYTFKISGCVNQP